MSDIKSDELRQAYHGFFVKGNAGQFFIKEMMRKRLECHENAEKDPTAAPYQSQKAAVYAEVIDHINSVINPAKKGNDV